MVVNVLRPLRSEFQRQLVFSNSVLQKRLERTLDTNVNIFRFLLAALASGILATFACVVGVRERVCICMSQSHCSPTKLDAAAAHIHSAESQNNRFRMLPVLRWHESSSLLVSV